MLLWVDKYRPRRLEQLTYHESVTLNLRALALSGDFPHLLVYGPPGAGKKTRIYATLHELFGSQVERLKIDAKRFTTTSNRKLECNVLSSPCHLEITPADMGIHDRVVIQDLLKEVAATEQVDFANQQRLAQKHRFKVVVVNEADSLTRDAQAALRRTMEKYLANVRLVLVCNTVSSIIAPIKLRTLLVRVAAPADEDIVAGLETVCDAELVPFEDRPAFLAELARSSGGNMRRALLSLETVAMLNATVPKNTALAHVALDWETVVGNMALLMAREQTVAQLAKLRGVFYELLSHCIPARVVLRTLLLKFVGCIPASHAGQVAELAAVYDERLSLGQKAIFHLEGFAALAMAELAK